MTDFHHAILEGIPSFLPEHPGFDPSVSHAPIRKDILTRAEKGLALENALRYFPPALHAELAPEFAQELKDYGRIYMYRYRPPTQCMPGPSATTRRSAPKRPPSC